MSGDRRMDANIADSRGNGKPARAQAKSLAPLRGLLPFLLPYKGLMAAAAAALALAAAATLALPLAARRVIDFGFSANNALFIDRYFLAMLAVGLVLACASAARFYFVSRLGERVVADLRDAVFRRLVSLSADFFDTMRAGEITSRLTADTTAIKSTVGSIASIALRNLVLLLGSAVLLAFTSPRLSALALVCIPLVVLPLILLGRRVRRASRLSQELLAASSADADESLHAIQDVQAFTREAEEGERFSRATEAAFRAACRRIGARALLTVIAIAVAFCSITSILWLGALAVLAGDMSAGELGQFILYAVLAATALGALAEIWGELQTAAGACERLMQLLRLQPAIASPPAPRPLPAPVRGGLEMRGVSFAYPERPEASALRDISFRVEAGESVALAGRSGAGKSSVFRLLLRFYDPQAGDIRIDGAPLREVDLHALRRCFALVGQEAVLFSMSVQDNIRYGRPDASDAEVRAAAMQASAHEFIAALPEGYKTMLGERGARLSGGQRQRIAIARALLRDAPILLLDEATNALDAESENAVRQATQRLMRNRTVLVIAHRLATIRGANRILLLDEGRLAAEGDHETLLQKSDLYRRLVELELRA